jgi:hypothetical protein
MLSDEEIREINPHKQRYTCHQFDTLGQQMTFELDGIIYGSTVAAEYWAEGFEAAQLKYQADMEVERKTIVDGLEKWFAISLASALGSEGEVSMLRAKERLQRHMEFKLKYFEQKILSGGYAPKP